MSYIHLDAPIPVRPPSPGTRFYAPRAPYLPFLLAVEFRDGSCWSPDYGLLDCARIFSEQKDALEFARRHALEIIGHYQSSINVIDEELAKLEGR